jgi:hypothetical protein
MIATKSEPGRFKSSTKSREGITAAPSSNSNSDIIANAVVYNFSFLACIKLRSKAFCIENIIAGKKIAANKKQVKNMRRVIDHVFILTTT